jgi:hypothetical protein
LPNGVYNGASRALRTSRSFRSARMDEAEFLKLLTHIHDEMLERVKEQYPSHEQFAAWLLGQIEGRLRMRIGTVKTT